MQSKNYFVLALLLAVCCSRYGSVDFSVDFLGRERHLSGGYLGRGEVRPGGEQLTHHLGPHKVQGWVHTLGSRASERTLQSTFLSCWCFVSGTKEDHKAQKMPWPGRLKATISWSKNIPVPLDRNCHSTNKIYLSRNTCKGPQNDLTLKEEEERLYEWVLFRFMKSNI